MVMNRLEAAAELPENRDPAKQAVIRKVMELLVSGNVKDPGMPVVASIEAVSSIPEGAIRLPDVQTVGMSNREMEKLADVTRGLNLGAWGKDVLKRAPVASKKPQTLSPIAMDAHTMGINGDYPTTNQVWEKAKEFGDRVTAEEMLQIAIETAKGNIQVEIGKPLVGIMEPVSDSHGNLNTLYVARSLDGLWLSAYCAYPAHQWPPGLQFVVSARK